MEELALSEVQEPRKTVLMGIVKEELIVEDGLEIEMSAITVKEELMVDDGLNEELTEKVKDEMIEDPYQTEFEEIEEHTKEEEISKGKLKNADPLDSNESLSSVKVKEEWIDTLGDELKVEFSSAMEEFKEDEIVEDSGSKVLQEELTEKKSCQGTEKNNKRSFNPCPYCSKFIKRFSDHLQNKHKCEPEMKEISRTKDKSARKRLFYLLKVKGIQRENEKRKGTKKLLRLRVTKNDTKSLEYQCSSCLMIYSKNGISSHKRVCNFRKNRPKRGGGLVKRSPFRGCIDESLNFLDEKFLEKIIHPMHEGPIKNEILKDIELLYIGDQLFVKKIPNNIEAAEGMRKKLRYLSKLKISFNIYKKGKENLRLSEILSLSQWFTLLKIIKDIIYRKEFGKKPSLKRGTANQLKYSIKQGIDALIGLYGSKAGSEAELRVQSLTNFKGAYDKIRDSVFGRLSINAERHLKNDSVKNLPSESELCDVMEGCDKILNSANLFNIPSESEYVQLRRAAITRLIFFNCRRPVDVALLKISRWELAKQNSYLPTAQVNILKEQAGCNVLDDFRVMTMGKRDDVSILVPKSLFKALDILANPEVRSRVGVLVESDNPNPYLFPSTKRSENPCSGTKCVEELIKGILPESSSKFTSVQVRRLLASKFGLHDFPEVMRELVFKFFGHSDMINELNYCYPNVKNVLDQISNALSRIESSYVGEEENFTNDNWNEGFEPDSVGEIATNVSINSRLPGIKKSQKIYSKSSIERSQINNSPGLLNESDSEDICREPCKRKRKFTPRMHWSPEQNHIITSEFKEFISGQSDYPNKSQVHNFLETNPNILGKYSLTERVNKLRIKINNLKYLSKIARH